MGVLVGFFFEFEFEVLYHTIEVNLSISLLVFVIFHLSFSNPPSYFPAIRVLDHAHETTA
jgi:hypothetical protein